jgi:hypothetical protein
MCHEAKLRSISSSSAVEVEVDDFRWDLQG